MDEMAQHLRMTQKEFEAAVWAAWCQLFVTTDEAVAAIEKFKQEGCRGPQDGNDSNG